MSHAQTGGEPAPAGQSATTESSAADLGKRQVRGSTLLLAGRLGSMLLTVSTQVILVRALSKTEFGAFAFALAITSACRTVLSLGQGKSLSRHLAFYEERGEHGRMFGAAAIAFATITGTSLVLVCAVLLGRDYLAGTVLGEPSAAEILAILVFLAPLEALDEVLVSWFAVFSKPTWIFFRRYLLAPGLRFVVVLSVLLAGGSAVLIALGYLATTLIGQALYITMLTRLLRHDGLLHHLRPGRIQFPFRDVFGFSIPLLSTELVYLSTHTGSVLLLAKYWGAAEVAEYRAAFPVARLNQFVMTSFMTLYLPTAARIFARGDRAGLRSSYWHTALILAVFSFPVFALTVPFASATTVTLFGQRYADSSVVLVLLSIGYYFSVCLGFNAQTLQVMGRVRYLLWVNVFCAAFNIGLAVLLVPQYGPIGVGVANTAMLVVQNVLNQLAVGRQLGGSFIERRYLRAYGYIAVAALLLVVIGTALDPPLWVALPISALVSIALLRMTRRLLDLAGTFPELLRIPLVSRLI